MVSTRQLCIALLAAGSTPALGSAQTLVDPQPAPPPVYRGVFDVATGTLYRSAPGTNPPNGPLGPVLYRNNAPNGMTMTYDLVAGGLTVYDEGRIPSLTSMRPAGTLDSYQVTGIQLAYATDVDDATIGGPGPNATLVFYESFVPCMNPSYSPQPIATIQLTGMPGSLSGGVESIVADFVLATPFCLRADGNGTFTEFLDGFGWSMSTTSTGVMGPISAGDESIPAGHGTAFLTPMTTSATGLSTLDLFYETTASGGEACRWFGGAMNGNAFASFHLLVHGDLTAECDGCVSGLDDHLENNDTCVTANANVAPGVYSGLVSEANDADYYSVQVPPGTTLRARMLQGAGPGNVDLGIFDACGGTRAASSAIPDGLQATLSNTTGGMLTYVIEVVDTGGDCDEYNLGVLLCDDLPCTADAFEPNNDCTAAVPLPLGNTLGLNVSACDEDYYSLTLAPGESFAAGIAFAHATADLDLLLYEANASFCGTKELLTWFGRSASKTDDELLSYTNETAASQNLVLKVDHFSGPSCAPYRLVACQGLSPDYIGRMTCIGVANSTGNSALLCPTGSIDVASNDVTLDVTDLPLNSFGYFVTSKDMVTIIMNPGGSSGNLCVSSGNIGRYAGNILNSGSSGAVSLALDLANTPQATGTVAIGSGEVWFWQYWYRDSIGGSATSNFSTAVRIEFQ